MGWIILIIYTVWKGKVFLKIIVFELMFNWCLAILMTF